MKQKPMPLKQWLVEESQRIRISVKGVRRRVERGKYPSLQLEHINPRVILVLNPHEFATV